MSTGDPSSSLVKPVSRRDMLWLMLTSGAALLGGGSLSWALQRDDAARAAESRATSLVQTLANSGGQIAELTDLLRAAESEIGRLAAELAQTRGVVEQYKSDLAKSQADLGAAQSEAASLREQLAQAETQRSTLQGLVGLLEGLEGIGLDDILQTGLAALMGVWAGLGGLAPVLHSGVELAAGLLDEFEAAVAGLREKLQRSGDMLASIKLDVERVETASAQAVLTVGPLFEPVAQFANFIVEQLPFDISAPFEYTLNLVRRMLLTVPKTVRNLEQLLVQPLDRYLGAHAGGWTAALVAPVREQLLTPASELLDKWGEADATFAEKVVAPATAALEKRAQLRSEIAAYKSQHGLT